MVVSKKIVDSLIEATFDYFGKVGIDPVLIEKLYVTEQELEKSIGERSGRHVSALVSSLALYVYRIKGEHKLVYKALEALGIVVDKNGK